MSNWQPDSALALTKQDQKRLSKLERRANPNARIAHIENLLEGYENLLEGYEGRNKIINGDFRINQRAAGSGLTFTNGSYFLDRWFNSSGISTASISWSSGNGTVPTTVSLGSSAAQQSIAQKVEPSNLSLGDYVLNHAGTARARMYRSGSPAPAFAACPLQYRAKNLLTNPSGRTSLAGYVSSPGPMVLDSGSGCYTLSPSALPPGDLYIAIQTLTVGVELEAGATYAYSAQIYGSNIDIYLFCNTNDFSTAKSAGGTYSRHSLTFTAPASGTVTLYVTNKTSAVTGSILAFNDAQLEKAPAFTSYDDSSAPLVVEFTNNTSGAAATVRDVQLEVGSTPTPFERVLASEALARCQRYFWRANNPAGAASSAMLSMAMYFTATGAYGMLTNPVTMRASPTLTISSQTAAILVFYGLAARATVTVTFSNIRLDASRIAVTTTAAAAGAAAWFELDPGHYIDVDAEL